MRRGYGAFGHTAVCFMLNTAALLNTAAPHARNKDPVAIMQTLIRSRASQCNQPIEKFSEVSLLKFTGSRHGTLENCFPE